MTDPQREPGLTIAQIILTEAHFTHRDINASPPEQGLEEPAAVEISSFQLRDGNAAVTVRVSTPPESQGNYQFDVQMMAIVKADPEQQNVAPAEYVTVAGAALLYPFVREVVANLSMRGRFGPVWLRPLNVQLAVQGGGPPIPAAAAPGPPTATTTVVAPAKRLSRAKRAEGRRR